MELILQNLDLLIFLILLVLGYLAGTLAEKRHYRSIIRREKALLKLPVVTAEGSFPAERIQNAELVCGSVVISIDYFKRLLAILRNIFGGRVKSYESLVDRARREAILRMKEEADRRGAKMVINMRLATAAIGKNANRKKNIGSVEAIAYGTAVVLQKT
ncbi:YbjQ family protein [Pelobacter seleniigenes]|uniref:YbjQ family protein n=1 Tax=Pelobacter seleniigenes TaxID=407188 RepID=UPI0004A73E26|nr:YbjQ family protein [Pelobacter seleniigenes]